VQALKCCKKKCGYYWQLFSCLGLLHLSSKLIQRQVKEHSHQYLKVKGSSPAAAAGTGREEVEKIDTAGNT
jgi:hypothetical protein